MSDDHRGKTVQFPTQVVGVLVTQRQIVEVLLLDAEVKQLARKIRQVREGRDEKKAAIVEALICGAGVEPGPHVAELKRLLRLDLI